MPSDQPLSALLRDTTRLGKLAVGQPAAIVVVWGDVRLLGSCADRDTATERDRAGSRGHAAPDSHPHAPGRLASSDGGACEDGAFGQIRRMPPVGLFPHPIRGLDGDDHEPAPGRRGHRARSPSSNPLPARSRCPERDMRACHRDGWLVSLAVAARNHNRRAVGETPPLARSFPKVSPG